jgi:hypothetical protein
MAATNLEQVKEAQEAILMAMITDPKAFAAIARDIGNNVETKQIGERIRSLLYRGYARSTTTNVDDEMQDLK